MKLEDGEHIPYLGGERLLRVVREQRKTTRCRCIMKQVVLWVPYESDYEQRKKMLEKWYRKEAEAIITEKAEKFAEQIGVTYEQLRIKDQKSRWGSCSSNGNVNFSWRIIMAPEAICDYVIIHELCHRLYMNHSHEFWGCVHKYCPDYWKHRKWLKENGQTLYPF